MHHCQNTDNGKLDIDGNGCRAYILPESCGGYDDNDFTSTDMCCICGGGTALEDMGDTIICSSL